MRIRFYTANRKYPLNHSLETAYETAHRNRHFVHFIGLFSID